MLQAAAQEPLVIFERLGLFVSFMLDTAATSMAKWSHRVLSVQHTWRFGCLHVKTLLRLLFKTPFSTLLDLETSCCKLQRAGPLTVEARYSTHANVVVSGYPQHNRHLIS